MEIMDVVVVLDKRDKDSRTLIEGHVRISFRRNTDLQDWYLLLWKTNLNTLRLFL